MLRRFAAVSAVLAAGVGLLRPCPHAAEAATSPPESVLVLGDSLTVSARSIGALVPRFADEGVQADVVAETSRDTRWALGQVQARATVPAAVVVFLGTNRIESDFRAGVDRLLDALAARGATRVVWLTPLRFGLPAEYADRVAILHDVARTRPALLRIADWHLVAAGHLEWAASDRIHLSGDGSRGEVVAIVGLSPEAVAGHPAAGLVGPVDPHAGAVGRIYRVALGRDPEDAGLLYWMARGWEGVGPEGLAAALVASAEHRATLGGAGDVDFVDALYRNGLGRPVDPAGADYWAAALASGTQRAAVAVAVAGCEETRLRTGYLA